MKHNLKSLISVILTLALLISCVPVTALISHAAGEYELYLAGTKLTDDNLSGKIDGTLSYNFDPESLTLELEGAFDMPEDYRYDYVLWNSISGLTVSISDTLIISAVYGSEQNITFIRTTEDMTITGESKLTIYGSGSSACTGIYVGGAELTIKDADIWIGRGTAYALDGGMGINSVSG